MPLSFRFLVISLCAVFACISAQAHPHVQASMETEILVNSTNEITGFVHKWTFDEAYSAFAVEGLDTNHDGVYSAEELKPLAKTNVESLQEFDYFTFAKLGDKKLDLVNPTKYHVDYKNNLVTLVVELPLQKPLPLAQAKSLSLMVYDPSYYVAMVFDPKNPNPVKIVSPQPVNCQVHLSAEGKGKQTTLAQMGENIDPTSQIGAQFAQTITLKCQ